MLKTKKIGKWTVSEAGMREAVRKMNMIQQVREQAEKGKADDELITALSVFPVIAGCVTPLLTIEKFLQIPEQELDELSKAAMELNPHWFVMPDQEKKTDETQSEPTPDSKT
jgi:hypothetical protein